VAVLRNPMMNTFILEEIEAYGVMRESVATWADRQLLRVSIQEIICGREIWTKDSCGGHTGVLMLVRSEDANPLPMEM
jgi:hypothetical protein